MIALFRHNISVFALIVVLCDLILNFAGVFFAVWTVNAVGASPWQERPSPVALVQMAAGFALFTSLISACFGLYRPLQSGLVSTVVRNLVAFGIGGYLAYLAFGLVLDQDYLLRVALTAVSYLFVGVLVARMTFQWLRRWSSPHRILVVGTGPEAQRFATELKTLSRRPCEIVGFYPTLGFEPVNDGSGLPQIFPRDGQIVDLVRRHRVREVIVAVTEQRGGGVPMDQLLACRTHGIPVLDLAGFYERSKAEVPIDSLKASWLVYGHGFVQGRKRRTIKRLFDIAASGLLLLLAMPVMLLAMVLIRMDSPGPVFYRQERVGHRGRIFMCLKLRSMRVDAERDGVARWAATNDPRVTRVGSFLRKTRIDELPQLFSVLVGEMSLVGPRPERPCFVGQLKEQIPFYDIRHSIKPGVTGWAQVRYSYGSTIEDARRKHQFDLYYVKNNSLFLDMLILIETVSVVLLREGV